MGNWKKLIIGLLLILLLVILVYARGGGEKGELVEETLQEVETLQEEESVVEDIVEDITLDYEKLSNGRVKEINFMDAYKQDEERYLVLFMHEQCDFCIEFWIDDVQKYLDNDERLEIYVVDLKEDENKGSWDYNEIHGVPLLMRIDKGIIVERAVGAVKSRDMLNNN